MALKRPRIAALSLSFLFLTSAEPGPEPQDATISSKVIDSAIVVTASSSRFAGAIISIKFRGVEYVDLADHGRQVQSALQVDNLGECFNPTEAGSRADGTAKTSSSVLKTLSVKENVMVSKTRAAFWLRPREDYKQPCSAYTKQSAAQHSTVLSDYVIERKTSFLGPTIPNGINIETRFQIPEDRNSASVEALTGYLTPKFTTFLAYDPATRNLKRLRADQTGRYLQEQLIIAQPNGAHAMGLLGRRQLEGAPRPSAYVYFYFKGKFPTAKWSCWFGEDRLKSGSTLAYACPLAVGTVDEVLGAIDAFAKGANTVANSVPLLRFYKPKKHLIARSFASGASRGYEFEGTGFHLLPQAAKGLQPLFQCYRRANDTYFASTQEKCEGARKIETLGYLATEMQPGLIPLYRFLHRNKTDILVTTDRNEGKGYAREAVLGFVKP